MMDIRAKLAWTGVAILGAVSLGIVALSRGETINAVWLVLAAICSYLLAYRFYALFIAERVVRLDGHSIRLRPVRRRKTSSRLERRTRLVSGWRPRCAIRTSSASPSSL